MRRGNMGDLRTAGPQCFHGQALAVKADGADGHIVRRVDAGDLAVAGVLDGIAQPAPEELHDEAIKVLRARADEDLLRRDAQAARLLQMSRNGSAQFRRTGKIDRLHQALVRDDLAHRPHPDGGRERHVLARAAAEVEQRLRRGRLRQGRHMRRLHRDAAADGTDIHAAARARLGIALGQQLGIGALHRDDAHAQMGGQHALGRQAGPGRQPSGGDIVADALVQLLIERMAGRFFQGVGQHGSTSIWSG